MISFVVPAHNEEALLGRTLASIHDAARVVGRAYEVIVADDASTDATAALARAHGALVVPVQLRKISAVRNAGARCTRGDVLVFVDADTMVPERTLRAALTALERGAVGGGALVGFDKVPALWAHLAIFTWNCISRFGRIAAGCFVFVRREAFEAVGGFDEAYFVTEELVLSTALKRRGRFVILPQAVVTSARKTERYGPLEMARMSLRVLVGGQKAMCRREGLEFWYAWRERDGDPPGARRPADGPP